MKVIAVVPAYNEAERIGDVVRAAAARTDGVIVVDDGSTDGTAAAAASAGASVITHVLNRGQGAALKTGTLAALSAGADVVLHIDADGQHDPDAIPALLAALDDADVVFGSRFLGVSPEGMPLSRRMLLWAARQFSALALGIPRSFTDPQSGLRAMRAEAAREIDFRQDRMAHCSEILRLVSRSGLRAVEIPVRIVYTKETLKKGQKATDALHIVWQLILGSLHR
jgi:glycosyltransferase involved in cell wall biosynthesis